MCVREKGVQQVERFGGDACGPDGATATGRPIGNGAVAPERLVRCMDKCPVG